MNCLVVCYFVFVREPRGGHLNAYDSAHNMMCKACQNVYFNSIHVPSMTFIVVKYDVIKS